MSVNTQIPRPPLSVCLGQDSGVSICQEFLVARSLEDHTRDAGGSPRALSTILPVDHPQSLTIANCLIVHQTWSMHPPHFLSFALTFYCLALALCLLSSFYHGRLRAREHLGLEDWRAEGTSSGVRELEFEEWDGTHYMSLTPVKGRVATYMTALNLSLK